MGSIVLQNILHFSEKNIFVPLQGRMGSKLNEFYWQHKNSKNHGDFICFRPCITTPPPPILTCRRSWPQLLLGVMSSPVFLLQVQPAGLSLPERRHHAEPTVGHEGLSQRPLLQVHVLFWNIFHLSDYLPPHTSVLSPLQPRCQHVCDRWGHPDAEGRAHCWRPAGSVHNQPLRALLASESRWIVAKFFLMQETKFSARMDKTASLQNCNSLHLMRQIQVALLPGNS